MKKLSILASLFVGLTLFTACESDRDENPVADLSGGAAAIGELVMNEPSVGQTPLDLENTSAITLVAQRQPTLGGLAIPMEMTYGAEMSLNGNWTDSASVYIIDVNSSAPRLTMSGADINRGIMTLKGVSDPSEVNPLQVMDVLVRMTAKPASLDEVYTAHSNAYTLKVFPFYQVLSAAEPDWWFLTGNCIGDGKWTANKNWDAYLSVFPMALIPDGTYDAKTGAGEFENTIYLPDGDGGQFKLRHYVDDWNEQWGWDGSVAQHNDGGSGNFVANNGAGYYTIHLDMKSEKVTFTKAEKQDYATYEMVSIIGLKGDWDNDIDMMAANNAGANNHLWTVQIEVTESTVFKFRANHDWGTNWGFGAWDGEVNLCGFGEGNGKNIGIEPGKWTIYFDDISGFYRVVSDSEKQKP